jgi:uncharacterized protein YbaR (Trm112 family)
MLLELAEFLLCPYCRDEVSCCVVAPAEMADRAVRRGMVGCPLCRREFPITDGVADFGAPADATTGRGAPPAGQSRPAALPDPSVVQALLGIAGPGGYVVLVGSAAALASRLAQLSSGVHHVCVDGPEGAGPSPRLSRLRSGPVIPLKSQMARGVVVGAERQGPAIEDAARVVLKGLRLVVMTEGVTVPGVEPLASGQGLWVGKRT